MAGNAPSRAGTRHGAIQKLTPTIVHRRNTCANCGVPLPTSEADYCRQCRAHQALYKALREMEAIDGGIS